jgi:copper chaperone
LECAGTQVPAINRIFARINKSSLKYCCYTEILPAGRQDLKPYKQFIMQTYNFRTTVKCGGCVATVTPFLDKLQGLKKWSFDLADSQRILTAEVEGIQPAQIIDALGQAGYKAEQII